MFKSFHKLTDKLKEQINGLVYRCNEFDNSNRSLYLEEDINADSYMKSFFLYYVDEYVVSVITATIIEENKVELRGFTLPEERRKGYFLDLLDYAEEEFLVHEITEYEFVVDPKSESARYVVEACEGEYIRSSYLLELNIKEYTPSKTYETLETINFTKINTSNLAKAIEISNHVLAEDKDIHEELLQTLIEDENQVGYLMEYDGHIVGVGNIAYGQSIGSIFGLGICSEYRGKQLGRRLLQFLLNDIKEKGMEWVCLEVSSHRKAAYHMYLSEGFSIKDQNDYYHCDIQFEDDYSQYLE